MLMCNSLKCWFKHPLPYEHVHANVEYMGNILTCGQYSTLSAVWPTSVNSPIHVGFQSWMARLHVDIVTRGGSLRLNFLNS